MKKLFFLSLFLCGYCVGEEEISLAACQEAAVHTSHRLAAAERQVCINKERVHEVAGHNLPAISAGAAYTIRDNHPGFVKRLHSHDKSPGGHGGPKELKSVTANRTTIATNLSLVVPIYDFGYVDALAEAQQSMADVSEHERARLEQSIILAVAQTYYAALEAAKLETVVLQSIDLLVQQLAITKDLHEVGLVTRNDLLGVEVQLSERQQEHIHVRCSIEKALASLYRLTQLRIDSVGQLLDPEVAQWKTTLSDCVASVTEAHPELRRELARIRAARAEEAAVRVENFPKINGLASVHSVCGAHLLHKQWTQAGVGVQIPLFDGGVVQSKRRQKGDQIRALELGYEALYKDICLKVTEAVLGAQSAYGRIEVAERGIRYAEEHMKIGKEMYAEGLLAIDDLLNNESRLARARSAYFQAVYSFKFAEHQLAYAIGEISYG